jgi:hypothetical protein
MDFKVLGFSVFRVFGVLGCLRFLCVYLYFYVYVDVYVYAYAIVSVFAYDNVDVYT